MCINYVVSELQAQWKDRKKKQEKRNTLMKGEKMLQYLHLVLDIIFFI